MFEYEDVLITRFDDKLEYYKGFFDRKWAKKLFVITDSTEFKDISFGLVFQWWCVSQARSLPWFICEYGCKYERAFIRDFYSPTIYAVEQLVKDIEDKAQQEFVTLSERKRKIIRNILIKNIEQFKRRKKDVLSAIKSEAVWLDLTKNDSFIGALVASESNAYSRIYFEYENFLSLAIRKLTGKDKLFGNQLPKYIKEELGEELAKECYKDKKIELIREVRHAIVHNCSKITQKLEEYRDVLIEKRMLEHNQNHDQIVILARHTNEAFDLLKERILVFAEKLVDISSDRRGNAI